MKKLLIFLVMTIMTMGAIEASAQSSSSSFGINTFCEPLARGNKNNAQSYGISNSVFRKIQCMRSEKAIYTSLLKAGFTCTSKKYFTVYDESISEYITYLKASYSKTVSGAGKILVQQDWGEIKISFPNITERDKFAKTIKAEQSKGYIYTTSQYYWVGVRIEISGYTMRLVELGG